MTGLIRRQASRLPIGIGSVSPRSITRPISRPDLSDWLRRLL